MKRFLIVLASIIFIIGFATFLEQLTAMPSEIPPRGLVGPRYHPDQVSIRFTRDFGLDGEGNQFVLKQGNGEIKKSIEKLNAILLRYKAIRIDDYGSPTSFFVFVPKGTDLKALSQEIKNIPIVRAAGPVVIPDPLYP